MRCVPINGVNHVFIEDIAAYYGMGYHATPKQVQLRSRFSRISFVPDRRESVVNSIKVNLSYAPQFCDGEAVLSEFDFRLLLDPIMRPAALPRKNLHRIFIDPGHGGRDHGASGRKYREKDVTLQIARRLRGALRRRGYTVALTRTRDQMIELSSRAAMAEKWKADIFVSLHANSAAASRVKGIETFLLTPKGTASTYGNEVQKTSSKGNNCDKLNARLAYEIQKELVNTTQSADRGIKHANFVVLRLAPCAAVLVEIGFLSNADEEKLLGSSAYQEKIATAIENGILKYHRSLVNKE